MPAMGHKKQDQTQSEINFTLSDISSIITMLRENEVFEFCLEKGGDKLWLKRGTEPSTYNVQGLPASDQVVTEAEGKVVKLPVSPALDHSIQNGSASPSVQLAPTTSPAANIFEVISPMVGTFFRRPAVDAEAYVEVGDLVKKGDVLCIIEAMKIMNELEAETGGRIVEICLEDGQMAEYGEVLFKIETGV